MRRGLTDRAIAHPPPVCARVRVVVCVCTIVETTYRDDLLAKYNLTDAHAYWTAILEGREQMPAAAPKMRAAPSAKLKIRIKKMKSKAASPPPPAAAAAAKTTTTPVSGPSDAPMKDSKHSIPELASSAYFSAWNQLPGDSNAESVVGTPAGSDMDLVPLACELRDAAALGGSDGRNTKMSTMLAPLRKTDLMFLRHLEDET